jgi:hypothetical protein
VPPEWSRCFSKLAIDIAVISSQFQELTNIFRIFSRDDPRVSLLERWTNVCHYETPQQQEPREIETSRFQRPIQQPVRRRRLAWL